MLGGNLGSTTGELIAAADAANAQVARSQRQLLAAIAEIDRQGAWEGSGARDAAHWVSMRYGVSAWKAQRWVAAAHALATLPCTAGALASGRLAIDKIVELARFATIETEGALLAWADDAPSGAIRRRADLEIRRRRDDVVEVERDRYARWWWFDDGRRIGLEAELPADQGAVVANALSRLAASLPVMPESDGDAESANSPDIDARRADALVAMCSARIAADADPDRASVVVHASIDTFARGGANAQIEDGPVIAAESLRRLACDARIQLVLEDGGGQPVRLGRMAREPSASMMRLLRHRDSGCRFPGCGSRAFTHAHHVVWWSRGGPTDLENLVLLCSFHHRLVHEHGWRLRRDADGTVRWFRPDGVGYRAGPGPLNADAVRDLARELVAAGG